MSDNNDSISCPVCNRSYQKDLIEEHVNKCLFLTQNPSKRSGSPVVSGGNKIKRKKNDIDLIKSNASSNHNAADIKTTRDKESISCQIPLAERMRPTKLDDLVGQTKSFGAGSMLHSLLRNNKVTNMILWGPPGCGKTSLANVISNICKSQNNLRFVKLSATISGISDVKDVVKIAKNEAQFKKQTVLFMDEIHRFNKLQQDTFLPHVENGTIILIGATTENPSFSLNNALLSRCKVVVMEKLSSEHVVSILEKAINKENQAVIFNTDGCDNNIAERYTSSSEMPRHIIERASLKWLADICDGDARVALGALELALSASEPTDGNTKPALITLEQIKDGIKRSHMLYDKKGEEHYNIVSAIHKSIRASDDNAALYWTTRALHGGEDPLFIARRLVRAASEDIGLADPNALVEAVACVQGCQHIGMPECDVLLAQCAVRLARAPKSVEVYHAMKRCRAALLDKGPLPLVPLHLRNATTKLMKQTGYGKGYNTRHKDDSGLSYMPEGMEDADFFTDQ